MLSDHPTAQAHLKSDRRWYAGVGAPLAAGTPHRLPQGRRLVHGSSPPLGFLPSGCREVEQSTELHPFLQIG